jgi:hypothetical protein
MRLVKFECDIFSRLISVRSVLGFEFDTVIGGFYRRSFSPWGERRNSEQYSQLSTRLLVRKAPGDLFELRKEKSLSHHVDLLFIGLVFAKLGTRFLSESSVTRLIAGGHFFDKILTPYCDSIAEAADAFSD